MDRLKAYRARLIVFPRRSGKSKAGDASKEQLSSLKEHDGHTVKKIAKVLGVVDTSKKEAVREVNRAEMGEGTKDAYRVLRDKRSEARLVGVREKRAKVKAEEASAAKK